MYKRKRRFLFDGMVIQIYFQKTCQSEQQIEKDFLTFGGIVREKPHCYYYIVAKRIKFKLTAYFVLFL